MSDDEASRLRGELSHGLMQYQEMMSVMIEAAKGMRTQMEADGWSPTAGEAVALEWLMKMIRSLP